MATTKAYEHGQLANTLSVDASGNMITAGHIDMADSMKLRLGASDDLQVYHDGSNSYIVDNGTGDLNIRGSDTLRLQNATGTNYLYGTTGGQVVLYHNGSNRLSTTSTGVSVTGTVSATSFAGDGANLTGIEAGIGYDQSWTNVTSSRSENTNYTNSTGKPIMVNVYSNQGSSGSADTTTMDATVDGTTFRFAYHIQDDENYTARSRCVGNFIVPAGSTYKVVIGGNTINQWYELR